MKDLNSKNYHFIITNSWRIGPQFIFSKLFCTKKNYRSDRSDIPVYLSDNSRHLCKLLLRCGAEEWNFFVCDGMKNVLRSSIIGMAMANQQQSLLVEGLFAHSSEIRCFCLMKWHLGKYFKICHFSGNKNTPCYYCLFLLRIN